MSHFEGHFEGSKIISRSFLNSGTLIVSLPQVTTDKLLSSSRWSLRTRTVSNLEYFVCHWQAFKFIQMISKNLHSFQPRILLLPQMTTGKLFSSARWSLRTCIVSNLEYFVCHKWQILPYMTAVSFLVYQFHILQAELKNSDFTYKWKSLKWNIFQPSGTRIKGPIVIEFSWPQRIG